MSVDIWTQCAGKFEIEARSFNGFRCVEDQHQSASRSWVDTNEEHDLLEEIIDDVKPLPPKMMAKYDYLLITPFRHKSWCSRFSLPNNCGYLYGSLEVTTCLTEVAYYRFRFFSSSRARLEPVDLSFCVSNIEVNTDRFVNLCEPPFSNYVNEITSPTSYAANQHLGGALKKNKIGAFFYPSARSRGINFCLLSPSCLKKSHLSANDKIHWRATITDKFIAFFRPSTGEKHEFSQVQFLINGSEFPIVT